MAGRAAPHQIIVGVLVELAVMASLGFWGWSLAEGGLPSAGLALLFVTLGMFAWGAFKVPEEAPRGRALVPVPGPLRLAVELTVLAAASYGLWTSWSRAAAETLMTVLVVHYALQWERDWRLLRNRDAQEGGIL